MIGFLTFLAVLALVLWLGLGVCWLLDWLGFVGLTGTVITRRGRLSVRLLRAPRLCVRVACV